MGKNSIEALEIITRACRSEEDIKSLFFGGLKLKRFWGTTDSNMMVPWHCSFPCRTNAALSFYFPPPAWKTSSLKVIGYTVCVSFSCCSVSLDYSDLFLSSLLSPLLFLSLPLSLTLGLVSPPSMEESTKPRGGCRA